MITLKDARHKLNEASMTIWRTAHGEYCVNFVGGRQSTAYYTEDLDDALATGLAMRQAERSPQPAPWSE